MNTITVDGFNLTWEEHSKEGTETYILLNGWCCVRFYWTPVIKDFSRMGRCITLDLPGHYPSTVPDDFENFTQERLFKVVGEAVKQIAGDKKVILVGHSTGATGVVGAAFYFPDLVKAVISICPVMHGPVSGMFSLAKHVTDWHWNGVLEFTFQLLSHAPLLMDHWFRNAVYDGDKFLTTPGIQSFLYEYYPYLRKLNSRTMGVYMQMLHKSDIRPFLRNYHVPTLFIAGRHDNITPEYHIREALEFDPEADYYCFEHSGHIPQFEEMELFFQVIQKWIDKVK